MADRIEEIRARYDAATPGKWYAYGKGQLGVGCWDLITADDDGMYAGFDSLADAEFVANSHEDIPYLLAEIERLRAPQWVSIKDEVPKADCWVYDANTKNVRFAYAEEIDAAFWNVTHWMPITKPEPPKEEI